MAQIAKNNKETALKIVTAIQSNKPEIISLQTTTNSIDELFDEFFVTFMARDPQTLSALGLFESIGIREHNAYLNNVSPKILVQAFKEKKEALQKLRNFSIDSLSLDQQISYKIFSWMLQKMHEDEEFIFHEYRINQMFGILSDLTILFTQYHELQTPEDIQYYIKRLERIPEQLQQTIELLEYQKNSGIIPPAFAIEKVINLMENFLSEPVTKNLYYAHLEKQMQSIEASDKNNLLLQAQTVIETQVCPAYRLLQTFCTQMLKELKTNHGVWALPNGDKFYASSLKRHTTTELSTDEIHELGLKEVNKIEHEMRAILAGEGIVNDEVTVGALMQELSKDNRFYFAQTEDGRKECLAEFEAILERCRKELQHLFDIKPKSPVVIKPVPKHEQEGQPGAYYICPSLDGKRPGVFFVNLRNMNEMPKYGMETLAIHEAEPGHHFQIALQQESDMPIMRKLGEFTAYVEGWALYVEKLAYEQGFYSSSFAKLGHLQDEMWRAVRLVVDTGIHSKKWSREKAIEYMQQTTGDHLDNIITEVERYFVLPGQACSYKIGQLKILELRQRAKNALGTKFDIREFHNVVLKIGACPLTVLEEIVEQYIKNKLMNTR